MHVMSIKLKYVLGGALVCAGLMGCAGANVPARNVRETTSIMSLGGGVPGIGVIGLAASAIELISKVKYVESPGVGALFEPYAKQKKARVFMKFLSECKDRFSKGDWGDDDAVKSRNVADYEAGKRFGVTYTNTEFGFVLVYTYSKSSNVVTVMTPQEWQNEAGKQEK